MKSAAIRRNALIPTEPRGAGSARSSNAKILVVDVGGTHVKILATGQPQPDADLLFDIRPASDGLHSIIFVHTCQFAPIGAQSARMRSDGAQGAGR